MKLDFFTTYLLPQIGFLSLGMPRNGTISVDVTSRCNLRCNHCYHFLFNGDEAPVDNTDLAWHETLQALKKKSLFLHSCTFVGGEPLIRQDLVRDLTRYFRYNLVVTNGSIPLPQWRDVYFHVSIDGTEEVHDRIRNQTGLYRKVRKNVRENAVDMNVTMVTCLTNENKHCIEDLVLDWHGKAPIRGFIFDFYTPSIKDRTDPLVIPHEERDAVIDRLMELRRTHGDFLAIPADVYELMRSANYRKVVDNCTFRRRCTAFDSAGSKKDKCVIGGNADCTLCGCIVPYYLHLRLDKKYILSDVLKTTGALLRGKSVDYS